MLIRFILLAIFFCSGLQAVTPDVMHPLTLSELIDIALENNPNTQQAWWYAHRAAAAVGSAKSSFYPQVSVQGGVSHGRTFKYVNGPDTNYTIVGADLFISLLLFDCGERCANVISAKNALLAANWHTDWSIQKVIVRVLENAYALSHSQEVLRASQMSLEDAERMLHKASELNRNGLAAISDVYTTRATVSQMKMEKSHQKALLDIQVGKLASSIGLPADTMLELAPFDLLLCPQKQHTSALIDIAYQQRADLLAKQALVDRAYANYKRVRSSYGPKISLSGRGGANHAFHDHENGLQYEIKLNLEMPLFDGFASMYEKQIASADTQISIEERNELELTIAFEVLSHSRSLEAAQEMLPDANDNLQNAQKAYESVLERYAAGKESIAEVSNALRQLASARIRYSDVKTRWLVSLANLAYATGTLAPQMASYTASNMETTCE